MWTPKSSAKKLIKGLFLEAGYEIKKLNKVQKKNSMYSKVDTILSIPKLYKIDDEFLHLPDDAIDFRVKRIGFGTSWKGEFTEKNATVLLQRARELGVNVFDTADVYGPSDFPDASGFSEKCLAKAFGGNYENILIVTKGGLVRTGPNRETTINNRSEYLRIACEESLRRLKTERIPLYFLHAVDPAIPIEETAGLLKILQDEGKIDKIGIGSERTEIIKRASTEVLVSAVQFEGNHNKDPDASFIDYCHTNKIIMLLNKPLHQGNSILADVKWEDGEKLIRGNKSSAIILDLLYRSPYTIPIPCTKNVFHLAENTAALRAASASSAKEIVVGKEEIGSSKPANRMICNNVESEIYSVIGNFGCAHVENAIGIEQLEKLKTLVFAAKHDLLDSLNGDVQPAYFEHYAQNSGRASVPLVHYPEIVSELVALLRSSAVVDAVSRLWGCPRISFGVGFSHMRFIDPVNKSQKSYAPPHKDYDFLPHISYNLCIPLTGYGGKYPGLELLPGVDVEIPADEYANIFAGPKSLPNWTPTVVAGDILMFDQLIPHRRSLEEAESERANIEARLFPTDFSPPIVYPLQELK